MKPYLKMSVMHLFFPRAVTVILIILGVALAVQRARACKKKGVPFFNLKGYRFFEPGYDKLKLWGSLVLFVLYAAALEPMGFVPSSILFITLFNILFAQSINFKALFGREKAPAVDVKSLLTSVIIGVVAPVFIWVLFYKIFNITLP